VFRSLGPFDRRPGGRGPSGWIFATEVDIYFDPKNTLRPDVAGWRRERLSELPAEVPIRVVPDWTCEVLSSNKRNDLVKKKRVYHQDHVAHYWVVDPTEETPPPESWRGRGPAARAGCAHCPQAVLPFLITSFRFQNQRWSWWTPISLVSRADRSGRGAASRR
jgi:Putative restriction endonuclease